MSHIMLVSKLALRYKATSIIILSSILDGYNSTEVLQLLSQLLLKLFQRFVDEIVCLILTLRSWRLYKNQHWAYEAIPQIIIFVY